MNNLLLLTLFSLVLWIIVLKKTRYEFFSSAAFTLVTVCVGVILLYFQSLLWNISISNETTYLIGVGLISLSVAEVLCFKQYSHKISVKNNKVQYYNIKYCNYLLLFYIVATYLYAHEISKLGQMLGYNDLSAIGEVKANMEDLNAKMNPLIKQMYKVVTAASYIHSLIFANNIFLAKSHFKKEWRHLIPFLCTVVITLASGGRLNIFKVMVGLIIVSYLILRESSNWKKLYIQKMLKIGLPLGIGFVFLFSAVSLIVKNNASQRDKIETFEYISYYAGSPIQVFNLKVEEGRHKWEYNRFGNYTFTGLYSMLGLGDDIKAEKIGSGMVYLGGNSNKAGNAQTVFGSAYLDFGPLGMAIFIFLSYFLFGRYYYKFIVCSYSSYTRNKRLLVYVYCYVSIIALAFYDNCYWILLSNTGIFTLLVLLIMYWFYFKKLLIKKKNN